MALIDPPAPAPELSILVVGYNAADWLQRCLDSLDSAGRPSCSFEVIVVDNASNPPLASVTRLPEQCRMVTLAENIGFGNGVNAARSFARGRRLLLLNPDVEVPPRSLDGLLRFHAAHPDAGIVGGGIQSHDGRVDVRNAFAQPTLWSQVCFATGASTALPRSATFNPEAIPNWDRTTARPVGVVTGCCMLLEAELFDELGGFDPLFFLYGEDVDLCRRAAELGYAPTVTPDASIIHEFGASSTPARKRILVLRGKATLYRKWGRRRTWVLSRALLATGVALRALLERLTHSSDRSWTGAWRAREDWIDGWTGPPVPAVVLGDSSSD